MGRLFLKRHLTLLRIQYFIGDFDGVSFTNENPPETVMWVDRGPDNYAAVTYNDAPDGRRILVGWMDNWRYAQVRHKLTAAAAAAAAVAAAAVTAAVVLFVVL